MENDIKNIMAEIFMLPPEKITKESIMVNVERWDSITHMSLIVSLEEFFKIKFEMEEMIEMTSFEKIVSILKTKNCNEN